MCIGPPILPASGDTQRPPWGAGTPTCHKPTKAPPTAEPMIHEGITWPGSAAANGIAPSVMNENPNTQLETPARTDSAHLAARKGLPYVFAGHFAPQQMKDAIEIYKDLFEPSNELSKPYVIVCLNAIVADTDEQAEYLSTTQAQVMVSITRGRMQPLQPPTDDLKGILTPTEFEIAQQRMSSSLIGSEETVKNKIKTFIDEHGDIDELMAISYIYDQEAQLDSYHKLKNVVDTL